MIPKVAGSGVGSALALWTYTLSPVTLGEPVELLNTSNWMVFVPERKVALEESRTKPVKDLNSPGRFVIIPSAPVPLILTSVPLTTMYP